MQERILNYISHKLRIDAHYLYKGFFWIGLATVFILVINFMKSAFFAHFLTPETFGTYRYIMTITEIAAAFSLTGASTVVLRSVAQGFEGTYLKGMREYFVHSWLSVLITTGVACYFFLKENPILGLIIAVAGILAPIVHTLTFYGPLLEGKKAFALNAKCQVISNFFAAAILILAVMKTSSLLILVLTYFLSYIIIHTLLSFYTYKKVAPNNKTDPKARSFTLHLSIIGILSTGTEHLDKVLLFHFFGPAQLAMYTFASALPAQVSILGKAVRSLIYPRMSRQSIATIKRNITKQAFLIFCACVVMFVSYIAIAPFIFGLFFVQYVDAVLMSQVYALSIFFIVAIPFRLTLFAHSRTKELYQTKIISTVTRLGLLAVALPLYGLWGVIGSFLLARFFEVCIFMYMVYFQIGDSTEKIVALPDDESDQTA